MCVGGQATIRKAIDPRNGNKFAIKFINKQNANIGTIKAARFEAEIMEHLLTDHENIMNVKDTYEDDRAMCLVMDLMADDVRNIKNINDHPLQEEFARKMFSQMVNAVNHCHNNNIVHRDIKMENFLIDFDEYSKKIQIKLTDFGQA